LPFDDVTSLAYTTNTIFVAFYDSGLYVSRNNGLSWNVVVGPFGEMFNNVGIVDNVIYVFSSILWLYYSNDNGYTWNKLVDWTYEIYILI